MVFAGLFAGALLYIGVARWVFPDPAVAGYASADHLGEKHRERLVPSPESLDRSRLAERADRGTPRAEPPQGYKEDSADGATKDPGGGYPAADGDNATPCPVAARPVNDSEALREAFLQGLLIAALCLPFATIAWAGRSILKIMRRRVPLSATRIEPTTPPCPFLGSCERQTAATRPRHKRASA
jgi:hypothetical protein